MAQDYLKQLQKDFGQWNDFRVRVFDKGAEIKIVSMESMTSDDKMARYLLLPLAEKNEIHNKNELLNTLSCALIEEAKTYEQAKGVLLSGNCLIFFENFVFYCDVHLAMGRSVEEPPTSMVVRGPREGFVEDMKINLYLIRKRLKSADLTAKTVTVGKYTRTDITVCFLKTVADQSIADKIIQRIKQIDIDGIIDSFSVAKYLDLDNSFLFKRVGSCEKPDIAVGKMLEGRIAIIVDGSPIVLTLPYLFIEDLQGVGDYHENSVVMSLSRVLRMMSVIASVLLPGVYVSLQRYNYQILPVKFLITILNATQAIPFSPLSEMIFVLVIFDILRESSFRMPKSAGMSLSLVGAVVLGDAAVKAGLLGAPAVMIGALSGIGLYTMPNNTLLLSLLRLGITFLGGITGIFGVLLSLIAMCAYCASLESYSSPYLAPFAPNISHDREDAVMLLSLFKRKKRPSSIKNVNETRQGNEDEK